MSEPIVVVPAGEPPAPPEDAQTAFAAGVATAEAAQARVEAAEATEAALAAAEAAQAAVETAAGASETAWDARAAYDGLSGQLAALAERVEAAVAPPAESEL